MKTVTPKQFVDHVVRQYKRNPKRAIFGWGAPGIGKTDGIEDAAARLGIQVVDVRLGTLTPPDLRGLPVPDKMERTVEWFAPSFLPQDPDSKGILLLDEYVQAPPTMQGLAQQITLARSVGEHYKLPDGWMVIALGNRRKDRASTFDMPAQTQNRFKHFEVIPEAKEWSEWAVRHDVHPHIISFVRANESYLHKFDKNKMDQAAWPSPRSWTMASEDYSETLDIDDLTPSVGQEAADQFAAYREVIDKLPDMDAILAGKAQNETMPNSLNAQYALVIILGMRFEDPQQGVNAFHWLSDNGLGDELVQVFVQTMVDRAESRNQRGMLAVMLDEDDALRARLGDVMATLTA